MKKLIFIFLLFIVHNVFAESVATVLFVTKKATAQHAGAERTLARGDSLQAGDEIITAAESTLRFRYLNGTLVTIGPASNYKIIAYDPAPKSDVVINAELSKGKLQSQTSGGKKREALKAGVVALAITGTKFDVDVSSSVKTNVLVENGKVEAGGKSFGAGDSFVATPGGVQSAPFPAGSAIVITPAMEAATTEGGISSTTPASVGSQASMNGAGEIGLLATTTVAGQSLSSSAGATVTPPVDIATFTITCSPTP